MDEKLSPRIWICYFPHKSVGEALGGESFSVDINLDEVARAAFLGVTQAEFQASQKRFAESGDANELLKIHAKLQAQDAGIQALTRLVDAAVRTLAMTVAEKTNE